jgi:hypothetical protein
MDDTTSFRPVMPIPDKGTSRRRRADLRLRRLLQALAVAPLLGAAGMTWGFHFLDGIFSEADKRLDWGDLILTLFSPSLWAVISGLAYLQTVTLFRDQIARAECLLLGCGSGYLMPAALMAGNDIIFHVRYPDPSWDDLKFLALFSLITLPFGLFGGWVFWRLGVLPATETPADFAAVFD